MIIFKKFFIFLGLPFSFSLNGVPSFDLLPLVPITTINDNNLILHGKECRVITPDHRPEAYTDNNVPEFTNYSTPKVELECPDRKGTITATLLPIDWLNHIHKDIENLPVAFKRYALEDMPEVPSYAIPYTSKIYPGKSYLVLPHPASLKEQVIHHIQRQRDKFKDEQLESLPQELKEQVTSQK